MANILLTNLLLRDFGGTEVWTYTMARELSRQGHRVDVYSPCQGAFARYFDFAQVVELPQSQGYDLMLINHEPCYQIVEPLPGFKVNTSHSTFLEVERLQRGADAHVAVSQEIAQIERKRGLAPTVIMNPIDFDRFRSRKPLHKKLKTVLYLSVGKSRAAQTVEQACQTLGVGFLQPQTPTFAVEDYINQADLVVGIGRCLLEAMACGRNVISADERSWMSRFSGFGFVAPDDFEAARFDNFSGRSSPRVFNAETLAQEMARYQPTYGPQLRSQLQPHCDVTIVTKRYLDLWKTSTNNAI